jgi:phage FluMu protein Com
MSKKSLPIKMLKKGELEKISANTAAKQQPVVSKVVPTETASEPVQRPAKDFKQYLNVFNFKCELPGSGEEIEFKPLTVANLKQIQAMDPGSDAKKDDPIFLSAIFDKIFENVITSEVDIDNMLLNDRFTLILEIRKKTSGETYQWNLKCPKCKSQSVQNIDFNKIPLIQAPQEIDYNVPISEQLSVAVDFLRRSDEKLVHKYYEEKHKGEKDINIRERQTEIASLMVAASIKAIFTPNGEEEVNFDDKVFLVENLPQPLYAAILDWQSKYYFGPDLKINIKCPHCDFAATQDFDSSDFFS